MQYGQPPIAIAVTFGADLIRLFGGGHAFETFFKQEMLSEESMWIHRSKNKPLHDIAHVYIVMEGYVYCRLYYGGHETGHRDIWRPSGLYNIDWPRMLFAGPAEYPGYDIPMKGFQGFRYIYEPLF